MRTRSSRLLKPLIINSRQRQIFTVLSDTRIIIKDGNVFSSELENKNKLANISLCLHPHPSVLITFLQKDLRWYQNNVRSFLTLSHCKNKPFQGGKVAVYFSLQGLLFETLIFLCSFLLLVSILIKLKDS